MNICYSEWAKQIPPEGVKNLTQGEVANNTLFGIYGTVCN